MLVPDYCQAELKFIAGPRNPRTGVALVGDWGGGLALGLDPLGSRIWGVPKLLLAHLCSGLGLSWSQNRVWPACGLGLQGSGLWFLLLVGEADMEASRGFLRAGPGRRALWDQRLRAGAAAETATFSGGLWAPCAEGWVRVWHS